MLKKKGVIFVGTAAVIAAGVLAGCGGAAGGGDAGSKSSDNVTVESIAKTASEKMAQVKSYSFNTDSKIDYSVSAEGVNMDMNMDLGMNGEAITDSKEVHIKMDMNAKALGQDMNMENEAYGVLADDGKYISYTKTNDGTTESGWKKNETETEINYEGLKNADIFKYILDGKAEAKLVENSEQVNGKDVYKLEVIIPGELFQEVFTNAYGQSSSADTFAGYDFTKINAKTDLYVYKDSGLLARTYMDIKEYGEQLIQESMSASSTSLPEGMTMEFTNFYVDMTIDDYDKIDKIEIPADVIKEAESNS